MRYFIGNIIDGTNSQPKAEDADSDLRDCSDVDSGGEGGRDGDRECPKISPVIQTDDWKPCFEGLFGVC